MVKCLFISSIAFDEAILTASSQSMPVMNLQNQDPERKWRATNTTPMITINYDGAGPACNALAIIAHNGTDTATLRIRAGLTSDSVTGIAAPYLDTGYISMWPITGKPTDAGYPSNSLIMWDNDQATPWWSIAFNDTLNTLPFEAGRIIMDEGIRPEAALSSDFGMTIFTKGEQRRGDFNRARTAVRGPIGRKMVLSFTAINKNTFRKDILGFQLRHGITKDFFFCADPSKPEDIHMLSMQALLESPSEMGRQLQYDESGGIWAGRMMLVEQL